MTVAFPVGITVIVFLMKLRESILVYFTYFVLYLFRHSLLSWKPYKDHITINELKPSVISVFIMHQKFTIALVLVNIFLQMIYHLTSTRDSNGL